MKQNEIDLEKPIIATKFEYKFVDFSECYKAEQIQTILDQLTKDDNWTLSKIIPNSGKVRFSDFKFCMVFFRSC